MNAPQKIGKATLSKFINTDINPNLPLPLLMLGEGRPTAALGFPKPGVEGAPKTQGSPPPFPIEIISILALG
jgi:hypothetical protein